MESGEAMFFMHPKPRSKTTRGRDKLAWYNDTSDVAQVSDVGARSYSFHDLNGCPCVAWRYGVWCMVWLVVWLVCAVSFWSKLSAAAQLKGSE